MTISHEVTVDNHQVRVRIEVEWEPGTPRALISRTIAEANTQTAHLAAPDLK